LLVTVPQTFPPRNALVEDHDYFAKWKKFDEEAFDDECGDELKELLRRAVRKAKFFLHPDKLPKDLTENQTTLFKSLWDVIADREAAAGLSNN
jgi:non-homologous end joining protein Ku